MLLPKKDRFIEEVISYIKFSYDKPYIKSELESHILDKIECYQELGYSLRNAEEKAVEDMGDAKEIGFELNKQHNPIIGWIWRVTKVAVAVFVGINIFIVGAHFLIAIFSSSPIKDIPKESIVYRLNINERVRIDDRVIIFTNVVYDKKGDLSIIYKYYETKLSMSGWSFGNIGEISDNLGNKYLNGNGRSTGGKITKARTTVTGFSSEADTVIINYDVYN